VDDDGTAYCWDSERRAFVPQEAPPGDAPPSYAPEEMVFPDDEEPPLPLPPPRRVTEEPPEGLDAEQEGEEGDGEAAAAPSADPAKRRRDEAVAREKARLQQRAEAAAAAKAAAAGAPKVNTSVYVTGLPDDATPEEVAAVFGRCGLLKEDDAGAPRVKLYRDKATEMLKGDGLVIYLKASKAFLIVVLIVCADGAFARIGAQEPSVALACTILDGASFRPGRGGPMSVTPAKFELKIKPEGVRRGRKASDDTSCADTSPHDALPGNWRQESEGILRRRRRRTRVQKAQSWRCRRRRRR
jgi:hypothetical protein